ncbi:hypothetical protein AYX14_07000 [Cryptococcus neoformans]|nr:hypothetical protein AYX14_07000 [Cryptococcus neoformans var. grubii]
MYDKALGTCWGILAFGLHSTATLRQLRGPLFASAFRGKGRCREMCGTMCGTLDLGFSSIRSGSPIFVLPISGLRGTCDRFMVYRHIPQFISKHFATMPAFVYFRVYYPAKSKIVEFSVE